MEISMKTEAGIPKEKCTDHTIKLLTEGYLYIPNRLRKYNTNLFETNIMCQKVVCMSGKEAAELFYDQNLFTRKGAIPNRIQESLFGKKGIQTLDGKAHMQRKSLFMSLMTPQRINQIIQLAEKQWEINSKQWERRNQIYLFDEASKLLFEVACKWAGVPIKKAQIKQKSLDMSAMIDALGAVGPRHWKGRCARNRCECWASTLIEEVRSDRITVPKDTALYAIAWYKDINNKLLSTEMATVELINILRPITAIATYITFGALALHMYPEYCNNYRQGNEEYRTMFIQEVRRFYPFGPFLGARVRNDFIRYNHHFKKGDLVFLDIYGTNHNKKIWKTPNIFDPENFRDRKDQPFDFIPQGGGDYKTGTRCPGEWLTIEILKTSFDFLAKKLAYDVPLQDFSYPLNRIPTLPKSKFIMTNIRKLK